MHGGLRPHSHIVIEDGVLRPHTYTMIEDSGLRPHSYIMIEDGVLRPHSYIGLMIDDVGLRKNNGRHLYFLIAVRNGLQYFIEIV